MSFDSIRSDISIPCTKDFCKLKCNISTLSSSLCFIFNIYKLCEKPLFFHLSFSFFFLLSLAVICFIYLPILDNCITSRIAALRQCHQIDRLSIIEKSSDFARLSVIELLFYVYLPVVDLPSVAQLIRLFMKDVCTADWANK